MSDTATIPDRRARKTGGVGVAGRASRFDRPVDAAAHHLRRWASTVDDRLKANHPNRQAWDERRRERFVAELVQDAPDLSERQREAVLEAFGALVDRATIPAFGPMPALVVPGRVGQLVARLNIGDILTVLVE